MSSSSSDNDPKNIQMNNQHLPQSKYEEEKCAQMNPGQMPMAPVPVPMPMNNEQAFSACNQGIANGFGAMFFNIRDPNFGKNNDPVQQSASVHLAVLISTIIFFVCLIVALIGLGQFLSVGGTVGLILGSYFLYLGLSIFCSQLREYLSNMKRFDDYQQTYNQMIKGQGYFTFYIQCYHYVTFRSKSGTSRRKVITHTATQIFTVSSCFDQSGEITSIKDIKNYVFIHYLKRYYFTDDVSQQKFITAFNDFVSKNIRDREQSYSHNFQINSFQEFVAFTALGQNKRSLATFYILTILGLALPYACIIQRAISRYQVGLLKRLTV